MEFINLANSIEEAVKYLNQTRDNDFQLEGNQVIEYTEDDSIYWSFLETNKNGKKAFRFYCYARATRRVFRPRAGWTGSGMLGEF